MRVLLVTLTDMLPYMLTKVLNSELEYCAIVVDEADKARYMLRDVPPLRDKIYPLYEFQECIKEHYFDCVIFALNFWNYMSLKLKEWGLPKNKLVDLIITEEGNHFHNFFLERTLRYFDENSSNFEMFATGSSRVQQGLMPKVFRRKLINFGNLSQDFYYDYQIARRVLTQAGGGTESLTF